MLTYNFESAKVQMHVLAYYYKWGRYDVWSTPRTEREMWFKNIQEQLNAENGINNKDGNLDYESSNSYKESH